jgi:hypothetical protein
LTLTQYTSDQNLSSTINLAVDGLLRGTGSKQVKIRSSANPIISVNSNLSDLTKSAVIENLRIEGVNGTETGILLQNVYNCKIRNISVENCALGIKLTSTGSGWSQSNRMEHVRMRGVNKGIQFAPGGTNNFGFTHIDDVGISLKYVSDSRGIEIGTGCKPYSSFIKTTIWSGADGCYGMWIDGEEKYSLINLVFERLGDTGSGGKGVYLGQNSSIGSNNQSFFLAAGNLKANPPVSEADVIENTYGKAHDIVWKWY